LCPKVTLNGNAEEVMLNLLGIRIPSASALFSIRANTASTSPESADPEASSV